MKLLIFLCHFVHLFCVLCSPHTLTKTHFNTFVFLSHITLKGCYTCTFIKPPPLVILPPHNGH